MGALNVAAVAAFNVVAVVAVAGDVVVWDNT